MSDITLTTLADTPHLFRPLIELIEKVFHYRSPHRFTTDFAPLMDKSNWSNLNLLWSPSQGQLIAHIGARPVTIHHQEVEFPFTFLGGIAVDPSCQGQGHLRTLMDQVLYKYFDQTCLFALWSDLDDLYHRFGFHLAFGLYEKNCEQEDAPELPLTKTQHLYADWSSLALTVKRSPEDWRQLAQITSAQCFGDQHHYYLKGKGQDLTDIIHDYSPNQLHSLKASGKQWIPEKFAPPGCELQYLGHFKIGAVDLFQQFLDFWFQGEVKILSLSAHEIEFEFQSELFTLPHQEFLPAAFGPHPAPEFAPYLKALFISGLDSI